MTVTEAVQTILRAFPDRFPIPLPASAVLVVALTLSINSWVVFDKAKDYATTNKIVNLEGSQCANQAFDYVIVGAGGAGMIVATRVANASMDKTVLLLEAGGEPSILNELPSMDFFLLNQPANTFIYNTTPQQYSCGHCDDRRSLTTRGKMLGGSTSTNFMMYVRGNREDYNRWVDDAGGDPQWSYKSLLPYFRKLEDYNGAHRYREDAHIYHGTGGLLNVATSDYMPGTEEFMAAAREKGYRVGDYNGAEQEVFSPIDVTTQDGWRESTYRAYYRDTGKPPNLCIKKYAQVVKINFDHSFGRPRAVGVTYEKFKKVYQAWAKKEVILCAGTIETPKLLMLSGVGPAYDLQALGIPVVKDLPVGQNLQDHTYTIVGPFMRSPSLNPNRDVTPQAAAKFLIDGSGAIAAPAGLAGVAFFTSPFASPPYPDLQVVQFSVALYPELPRDLNRFFGISESLLDRWFNPFHRLNRDARFLVSWLGRPKSVGYIRLASKNPYDNPIMDPRYLEHPNDLEALLYVFKKIVNLFETTEALNTPIFPKPVPNCEKLPFKSDDYYRCVIRHLSGSLYHHVGTCAMGKVVDNNLRVKGIDGLRVIDASVIPRTPNGNTQAATFVVAEKGADLIINGDRGGGWGWLAPLPSRQVSEPYSNHHQQNDYHNFSGYDPSIYHSNIPYRVPNFKKIPNDIITDNYLKDDLPFRPPKPHLPLKSHLTPKTVSAPEVPVSHHHHNGYGLNYDHYYHSSSIPEASPSDSDRQMGEISAKQKVMKVKPVTTSKPAMASVSKTSQKQLQPSGRSAQNTPSSLKIRIPTNENQNFGLNREYYYNDQDKDIFTRSSSYNFGKPGYTPYLNKVNSFWDPHEFYY